MVQNILVILTVLGALGYLIYRFAGSKSGGSEGCHDCSSNDKTTLKKS